MEVVIVLFIIGAVIALICVLASEFIKKRRENLNKAAAAIGFSYQPQLPQQIRSLLDSLGLTKTDSHGRDSSYLMSDVFQGTRGNIDWIIFQFHFRRRYVSTDGSPEDQTVAYARLKNFSFPKFSMGVRNISNAIANNLAGGIIDFTDYRDFSKSYQVRGEDEGRIRELFNPSVISFFEGKAKEYIKMSFSAKILNIIAKGNHFILYYSGRKVEPNNILGFINETTEVIQIFTK